MPKDYQEITHEILGNLELVLIDKSIDGSDVADIWERFKPTLEIILTAYGNARELEGEKKAVEEFENKRDDDSCECDNCFRWRKYYKNKLNYVDHIAKVKSELK